MIITARASAETLVHQMYSGGVHRDVGRPSLSAMLSGCMHLEMTCTGCIHVISEEVVCMRFREARRHYAGLATTARISHMLSQELSYQPGTYLVSQSQVP